MANKIQVKRGLQASLPTLDVGEPALTTNSGAEKVYIGTGTGNKEIPILVGGVLPISKGGAGSVIADLETHKDNNANPHNTVATGSYIGDETYRFINVGFTPKFLLLYDQDSAIERNFFFREQSSNAFRVYNSSSDGLKIIGSNTPSITDLGFNVNGGLSANRDGTTYTWVAWM